MGLWINSFYSHFRIHFSRISSEISVDLFTVISFLIFTHWPANLLAPVPLTAKNQFIQLLRMQRQGMGRPGSHNDMANCIVLGDKGSRGICAQRMGCFVHCGGIKGVLHAGSSDRTDRGPHQTHPIITPRDERDIETDISKNVRGGAQRSKSMGPPLPLLKRPALHLLIGDSDLS